MTTYRGFSLYDAGTDIRYGSPGFDDEQTLRFSILDAGVGARAADQPETFPRIRRAFTWVCQSQQEVKELRAFIDGTKGRQVPFWIPTWTRDVELTAAISGTAFTIRDVKYATRVFPRGDARRHFYLKGTSASLAVKATNAVDNGNGTETIETTVALGSVGSFPAISFLLFARLAMDEIAIEWASRDYAQARVVFEEVPIEATGL